MAFKSYSTKTSFIDFLLNSSMTIFFLFFMALALISVDQKKKDGVEFKAEYIITAQWAPEIDCDVDLWVRDPLGNKSSFVNKDVGLMHLERDDLGKRNDTIKVGPDEFSVNENKEYWVLRGIVPGEYTVNVHLYSCMSGGSFVRTGDAKNPINVEVVLQKVNPTLRLYQTRVVTLRKVWDEETAFSFHIKSDSTIGSFDYRTVKLVVVNGRDATP